MNLYLDTFLFLQRIKSLMVNNNDILKSFLNQNSRDGICIFYISKMVTGANPRNIIFFKDLFLENNSSRFFLFLLPILLNYSILNFQRKITKIFKKFIIKGLGSLRQWNPKILGPKLKKIF